MASFILRNEIFVDQDEWWQRDVQRSIEQTTYENMIVNDPFEVILENVIFLPYFYSVENHGRTVVHFWTSDNYSYPKMENKE
jgi:hypothetical protein